MLANKHLQILLLFTITFLKWGQKKEKETVYKIKSSHLYLLYIVLYTMPIVKAALQSQTGK